MKNFQLSASIICGDLLKIGKEIKSLEKGGIDSVHFDVMDGDFVPRFGFPPEIIKGIKLISNIPISVHMMISDPFEYAEDFTGAGADVIVTHIEPVKNLSKLVRKLRKLNIKVGLALKPETPLSILDGVLNKIDIILLMAIKPGILGQKFNEQIYNKVSNLKQKLKKFPNVEIEIDGGVDIETGPKLIKLGANILDCGTSSIYKGDRSLDVKVRQFRRLLEKQL